MLAYILIYFGLGTIWSWWLEYYTTKYLEGLLGEEWLWRERFFHITFWPVTFSFFIYNVFKNK